MRIEVINRRDLLKGLAVGGAALITADQAQSAETITKSVAKGGRIDVHHHTSPPQLRNGTAARAGASGLRNIRWR